ncbi:hypothetical protein FG379_001658, partial [Cryptosporidium bovis]|uniref:uncharacterized protein n=1 Tax=Cryptosporidium bovis TaxID=310047 RepID=UPI003519DF63
MEFETDLIRLKEKGNEYYSKGEYSKSIHVYTEILDNICKKCECNDSIENDNIKLFYKEYTDLKFKVLLNRSASYIKIRDFENGLKDCNVALEINNNDVKGLFRRANCLLNITDKNDANKINDLNKAIEDLKRALLIEKNNMEVKDLLLKLIEEKNKIENNIQLNQLPSEIVKGIYNLIVNENKYDINYNKAYFNNELYNKLNNLYMYIYSNGNSDIILNTSCIENIISIFEHKNKELGCQIIYIPINGSKDISNSIVVNSWNILSILLEDNDYVFNDLLDENRNDNGYLSNISNNDLKFKKYDSNTKNKQLINFRNSVKRSDIINYTDIKNFINNCIVSNINNNDFVTILNNIFNILFCINDQYIHSVDYIDFLLSLIDIGIPFINVNDNVHVLILLILRNLSILFKNRNSISNKLKALEYSREIENLINSLFKLSYRYYNELLFNNPSSNNNNTFNNIINN